MSYYGGYGTNMGYGAGMAPPYYGGFQGQQLFQQPDQGLIMVNGEEGARAYPLPPNKTVPLFDKSDMTFYLKSTDGGGYGTIRKFTYSEIINNAPEKKEEYLTRAEFEEWKGQYAECISRTGNRRKSGSNSAVGESGDT